jgi:hypothetical protein
MDWMDGWMDGWKLMMIVWMSSPFWGVFEKYTIIE